jgi:TolB-like protein/Tfp pilus assembly protein PilF
MSAFARARRGTYNHHYFMALIPGTKVGSYEIQSPLGAGGMGEVYRATDAKLGRDVALKVLPAEMAQDPERLARFRREAKALAQLDHPNIVTIYSVEESDGVHFLTMQLVEGQPLDRLICAGGLPLEQIVEIASALGDALAAAHEKGIVHRDLKPANVMVSNEGRVKVLDFGLAKDVRGSNLGDATMTSASRTEVGVVMGTPAYMSPEQTSGRPLDHRTDIFSLGVLLHEMATGRRPFEGSSSAELVSAILRDTPPSVTDVRPDLPSDLARIVRRCLEKDPRHRLQTARDVSNEFRDMARTASRPTSVSTAASRMALPPDSGAARADEGFWVAVLPFKHGGSNANLAALADGLTDDTITGLSKFSYLRVIARSSSSRYTGQSVDVRTAGKELNARYVMEGTLRQAGSKLRLAVQLVDSISGAHLWAENYERAFSPETIFELQDDLVPRIVSTVADMNGVLPRSMSEGLRSRPPGQLSPYEAVLRSFAYTYSATPEELAAARSGLEEAVRKAPAYSDAWAMLSFLCGQDYVHGYELQANALEIATSAARRAVALGASNHLAYFSLGQALWCQKDYDSFRDAAERAVVLNPMDGNSVAYLGELLIYAGSAERGMQLVERAKQLNPDHPGWYWFADFYHAYSRSEYRDALSFALKAKLRGNPLAPMFLAAAYGQLGDVEGGAMAAAELVKFRPELPALMRKQVAKVWNAEYGECFLEGLRKAGMEIPEAGATASQKSSTQPTSSTLRSGAVPDSGATRADEGFWIAVLPFKYAGTSTDLKALADGLSDEIVTGLSRFSYLRVIARGSTAKYFSESGDIRSIGKDLGARYVMEGNLRQAGNKLRVAVQLVDAASGAQMWAETYERVFSAEALFEVQDELVLRIVSTVADQHGVLPHSISSLIRNKPDDQLSPYEAVLRVFSFHERMSPEEHASVRALLERAVQHAPSDGDCWAMLATLYADEYMFGFSGEPDPLGRAQKAAQRAVELAPSSSLAYQALAQSLFFRREWQAFRPVAERTVALNRADGALHAFIGMLIALAGDWDRGCAVVDAAIQLNPHHPGWYWLTSVFNSYRKRDYRASAGVALRINMPGYFWGPATSAAALGQLGEHSQKALKELLVIRPDFARTARQEFGKWFDDELAEHYVEGLRKAGLHIVDNADASATGRASDSSAVRAEEGFWVAVLPFKYAGSIAEVKALADGLPEEIVTGLSRFSYLRVIARVSTAKYSSEAGDVRAIGKELGARYVMEGSIRQAGAKVRIAVQLIDANAGSSLWAETYDRPFTPEETLDVIDDVVPRIVATIGDAQGVLAHSMTEALRHRDPELLTPYEALLRSFGFHQHVSEDEHLAGITALESAVRRAPDHADCWAMLSWLYRAEYTHGYHARPDSMDRSLTAARRAVNLAPSSQLAHAALASAHFFRGELGEFRAAAERALALNRMQGYTTAFLGLHFAYSGDWERGCALAERATQLNPNHPGWYWLPLVLNAYRQHDGERALQHALKINMPGLWTAQVALTVVNSQLGKMDQARSALRNLLAARPDFVARAQEDLRIWWQPEMVEQMLGDLRKAGLEIPEDQKTVSSSAATAAPSIAVLPFANMSDDREQDYFSDGLAEEIINLMAQIPTLKVIARTSAFAFRGKEQDIRGIAETLGVSTILEGSVRRSGTRIRVTAQLINAADGSHLWSERYDRELSDIFAVQDEISAAIAKALRVKLSREAAPQRYTPKLEAYEAYLKGRQQQVKVTPESLELARRYYEQAIKLDPAFGMAHIGLAFYWMTLAHFGQHSVHEGVSAARAEVQRALDLDPSLADGHALLGYLAALFDSDWAAAEKHFDFPMAKQASFELVRPMYGGVLYLRGNAEGAIKLAEHAVEEDPLDVWAHMNLHAYLQAAGRDDEALEQLKKVVELDPNQVVALASMVMIHADKGEIAQALKIAWRAYAVGRWFPDTVGLLAALLQRNGEEEESRSIAKELGSGEALGDARAHALFHLICGEIDKAADWVEKAIKQRDSSMRFYLGFVICKGLRASHRWPKIAKMVNLAA